jgi:uncharacterized membrane protein YhaH (DUF805 family)
MTTRFLPWLVAGIILCAGLMVISTSLTLWAVRWHDARMQNWTSKVYLGGLIGMVLGLLVLLVAR